MSIIPNESSNDKIDAIKPISDSIDVTIITIKFIFSVYGFLFTFTYINPIVIINNYTLINYLEIPL